MMSPGDVPPLRIAENTAKRSNIGVFENYTPPTLTGASEFMGTVVEVMSGDTLLILPSGELYDNESKLKKVSLASVRAPRAGNEKTGKEDEPYSAECKDRLRVLTVGKLAKVNIHYEKEIPIGQNKTEKRQFGTISVGKKDDVGEVLISEGLATTQRHRDDDEKSIRYDDLVAAESIAKAANKGVHSSAEYKKKSVNDLSDPKKAKTYASSLQRAGLTKAVVDYCFNGSRFKLFVPSENCYIMFALSNIRCPQPSPIPGASNRGQAKAAEPFGDNSKRHSRLNVMQRTVEISCTGVTQGGVMTGDLFVGSGAQRRDFSIELVASGLASVDQRKIDYGEAPKVLIDSQTAAQNNKLGIWSIEQVKKNEVRPWLFA
jgi:staphylococcal nuclease domain-containing protein 1